MGAFNDYLQELENDETLEEGFLDRVKARAKGSLGGLGQVGRNAKNIGRGISKGVLKGDPYGQRDFEKTRDPKIAKRNSTLASSVQSFSRDLVKLKLFDDAAGKVLEKQIFAQLKQYLDKTLDSDTVDDVIDPTTPPPTPPQ